jgi:hypothetical protein
MFYVNFISTIHFQINISSIIYKIYGDVKSDVLKPHMTFEFTIYSQKKKKPNNKNRNNRMKSKI